VVWLSHVLLVDDWKEMMIMDDDAGHVLYRDLYDRLTNAKAI